MFLTRKLIADINPSRLTERTFSSTGRPDAADLPPQGSIRYGPYDAFLNRQFGTYLALK